MIEISHRTITPGSEPPAHTAEAGEPLPPPAADTAQGAASIAPGAPNGDPRARFDALFGPPQLLVALKSGPTDLSKNAANANRNDQQRAQDALKAGTTPPASHPRMQHVKAVQEQLKKEGLPADAKGVRVYVAGDSPDHGGMVVRTIAGPAGLAPGAAMEQSEKMPDVGVSRLPDEEARLTHAQAHLSAKTGMATAQEIKMWALDSLEAAYTQPKVELDYLVAHAPKDGQTKIVNMSWGMSEDALVAQATKAALGGPGSPLIDDLNAQRARQGKPALDLSQNSAKEEVRQCVAKLVREAVASPEGAKRLQIARAEATAAVAKAREAGFLPIAAAGNFFEAGRTGERSQTNENLVATIPGVLSVGSVALGAATKNGDETIGDDSSTGAAIAAPGVDVPVGIDAKGKSKDVSGTSFAAPYAAAVAALMIKANPNITPTQIEKILQSDAVTADVKGTQRDGAGVIDPVAAVRAARDLMRAGPAGFHTSQDLDPAAKRAALDVLRQLWPATSPAYKAAVNLINDDHFVELDVATQKNLLAGLGARKSDLTLAHDVTKLAASKEFNELGPAARARFAQNFVGLEPSDRAAAMKLLQRPDIAKLPTAIKDAITAAAAKAPADTATIDALVKRANDPSFKKLPADAQAAFFRAFERQHDTIEMDTALANKETLLKLVDSAAFKKLDATAQSRWMQALGSADPAVRDRSYERLANTLARTEKQPEAARIAALSTRASALDGDDVVRSDRKELPDASKKPPLISAERADQRSVFFNRDGKGIDPKKADVLVRTVTIEGQAIEVIFPRPMPENVPSIDVIAKGLAGLPAAERAVVKQVVVEPRFKDYLQAVSAKDGRPNRIFMGSEAPKDPREMTAILSHEAAHLLSADRFKADPALRTKWEAAIKADNHRVSDYATTSLQEDVAETVALYYQVKGTADEAVLKRDFPNRYALIKELLGEK